MSNRNLRTCNAHLTFGPGQVFGHRYVRYPERDGERKTIYYQARCRVCGANSQATREDVLEAKPGRCGCEEPEDVEDPNMEAGLAEPTIPVSPLVAKHTMEELIALADAKGWYLPILYEMEAGKRWHARFEKRDGGLDAKGRTLIQTREGTFAATAHNALAKAFEEIDNPGTNQARQHAAFVAKWAAIREARGEPPLPQPGGDSAARVKALLKSNTDLAFRLAEALADAINVRKEIAEAEAEAILSMDDGEDEL